jgi:hypothetical protein
MPLLGTGKADYGAVAKLASAATAPTPAQAVGGLGMISAKRQEP